MYSFRKRSIFGKTWFPREANRKSQRLFPLLQLQKNMNITAPDEREYLIFDDTFSYFSLKPYVVTPHLNHLIEMVQMRGHNIYFYAELTKIIPYFH